QARPLAAVEPKPARHPSDVAAAMSRMHWIAARRAELMRLGSVAAVVDDADQQLDAVTLHGLQLLDVLVEAAVAVDQHDLAVVPRRRDADRRRQARTDRTEIERDVVLAGRSAA